MQGRAAGIILGLGLLAAPAVAGPFDGVYRQTATSDCTHIGMDGGALQIADGVLTGVESSCQMLRPVNVRDMGATLYDMECEGEGDTWIDRALMMEAADGGLIMVWRGYAFKYDRCSEADVVDSAVGAAKPSN